MIITISFLCKFVLFLAISAMYLAIVICGPKKNDSVDTVVGGILFYTGIFAVLLACLYWC